jgi:DNA polymerase-3 subunit epsilon
MSRRHTRNSFHRYINPKRAVDAGALEVHGIDDDFLSTQPAFDAIVDDFLSFVAGAELVIHNAEFDVGFINHELKRLPGMPQDIRDICDVRDTLTLARRMHPGQRNNLDALAKRYEVDASMRELHGALLDAQILAEVYLAMTGGQVSLSLDAGAANGPDDAAAASYVLDRSGLQLVVIGATKDELAAHDAMLERMRQQAEQAPLWDRMVTAEADNVSKSP